MRTMRRNIVCFALVFAALGSAHRITAAEPTVVVQLKSIDGLLADVKYAAKLVGQENAAEQLDGIISAWTQDKGIGGMGLDSKRPFLAYAVATTGGQDSPFAVMIPISDETTVLNVLKSLPLKIEKGQDDIYDVEVPNSPASVHIRFANKYAYVTAMDRKHLDSAKLVTPDQLTPANANTLLGLSFRLDQIPDELKQIMLSQVERRLA